MPGGAAPRALLGVLALIMAIALAIVPVVEARPKDKGNGKKDRVAEETVPAGESGQADVVYVEDAAPTEQSLTAAGAPDVSNEPTLLELDADGDYIPDALDNCPNVQNPDQADADGDGAGDSCMVYQDTDGDTVPDKQDNCPNIATSDFSDRDGDGVGDSCDKSPDGIEPEPEPVPELGGEGGEGETEAPAPENGENLNGVEVERDGRARSRQRERTDISKPVITTGSDAEVDGSNAEAEGSDLEAEGIGGPPAQDATSYEEPTRDNPRRNEELIAEAAASGELFAPPEPPPVPQRAWDEEATLDAAEWNSIIKIDSGATDDAESAGQRLADNEPNDREPREARGGSGNQEQRVQLNEDVEDSQFARGWVRAKLLLQEELPGDEQGLGDDAGEAEVTEGSAVGGGFEGTAPVPVENGLVFTGAENDDESARERDPASETGDAGEGSDLGDEDKPAGAARPEDEPELLDQEVEPLDEETVSRNDRRNNNDTGDRDEGGASRKDGSRRDGSSRAAAAAAPERQRADVNTNEPSQNTREKDKEPRERRNQDVAANAGGWSDDHFFEGGSALDWRGSYGVAGTDDADLYLTQRSGAGPGKRRGFDYAIPVDANGVYLVRLYFAEPYWGAPGGPTGDPGQRIFSVTVEGETMLEDLDVFAEVGALTALVKQDEVDVQDGELNLSFTASEGEPIVAAIE
ncbi:MAG: thrombospondin type 3 repeat-containing protein, partial [Chloroflexi bacterium]|nr:thrombospondin type 3 repeat-containing protein [Chloroflexota bacterium]